MSAGGWTSPLPFTTSSPADRRSTVTGALSWPSCGNLVYAWPYEDRAAWVSRRHVAVTRFVARVTPAGR